jgi:hypothetical protein
MLFGITGSLIGALISVGYNLLAQLALVLMAGDAAKFGAALFALLVSGVVFLIVGLPLVVMGTIMSSFVTAGILHLCLLLVGGARQPFETTYRVLCYAMGSSALCNVIPLFGFLVAAVFQIIALIFGCWNAHETTLGKAVTAVLIPIAISCALMVVVILLVMSFVAKVRGA